MLNRIPKPEERAHSTTPTASDVVYARAITSRAERMREPRATLPKDQRFRSGPAASDSATTPAPPAAYKTETSRSDAPSASFGKSTSCANTVASTMLISAIINEMVRRTGWERTYRRPSTMSWRMVVARFVIGALKGRAIKESITAEATKDAASRRRIASTGRTTSSTPAASGPSTDAAAKLAWIRPLALTSSPDSTRLGMAPNSAATKKIETVDETNPTG